MRIPARTWYADTFLRVGRWTLTQYNTAMGTSFETVEQALKAAGKLRRSKT